MKITFVTETNVFLMLQISRATRDEELKITNKMRNHNLFLGSMYGESLHRQNQVKPETEKGGIYAVTYDVT